jgi:hypothetical protein
VVYGNVAETIALSWRKAVVALFMLAVYKCF